ncbi:hypothetical protein GRJ2_001618000 [Grus japonensis]|uniref:Uncharacterized protein n=1 Tax=Grus japonensis TaxID=30415 RepID=A0ABC9X3M0_GRUJA
MLTWRGRSSRGGGRGIAAIDAWNASDNGTANARSCTKYASWCVHWMFCVCWCLLCCWLTSVLLLDRGHVCSPTGYEMVLASVVPTCTFSRTWICRSNVLEDVQLEDGEVDAEKLQ